MKTIPNLHVAYLYAYVISKREHMTFRRLDRGTAQFLLPAEEYSVLLNRLKNSHYEPLSYTWSTNPTMECFGPSPDNRIEISTANDKCVLSLYHPDMTAQVVIEAESLIKSKE